MMKGAAAGSILASIFLITAPADAGSLPPIKTSAQNPIPSCATPGRLMAFTRFRNPRLDDRFDTIAVDYMRHGEDLHLRWDYAYFQMLLETGNLSFMRTQTQPGNVRPHQNNFAGLGATGNGEHGESFATVSTGVRAHLQHLLLYAGDVIQDPVAERTRKVQEWGVLTSWQKGFTSAITFADLARKWAPGSRGYTSDVQTIADAFYSDFCNRPDPRPEMASATVSAPRDTTAAAAAPAPTSEASSRPPAGLPRTAGEEVFRQALERARAEGNSTRSGLGATELAKSAAQAATPQAAPAAPQPPAAAAPEAQRPTANYSLLNSSAVENDAPAAPPRPEKGAMQTASAAGAARPAVSAPPAPKCRVWTASYGGQKAVIIRAPADQFVNYTVLEVNEGEEKRETDAYIAAYAKGGQQVGEFASQSMALDKAFDLCPEG